MFDVDLSYFFYQKMDVEFMSWPYPMSFYLFLNLLGNIHSWIYPLRMLYCNVSFCSLSLKYSNVFYNEGLRTSRVLYPLLIHFLQSETIIQKKWQKFLKHRNNETRGNRIDRIVPNSFPLWTVRVEDEMKFLRKYLRSWWESSRQRIYYKVQNHKKN